MNGSPSRPLAKEDMHALFDALSEKLRRKRARANIYVVGGSAMALAYTRERITREPALATRWDPPSTNEVNRSGLSGD